MMPRQHRLGQIVKIAMATFATLFLPRRLGGIATLLGDRRRAFIGAALVALFFAGRRIFRPTQACKPGEVCAIPQVRTTYKLIFWIVAALVLVALGFPYAMPFFY